MAEYSGIVTNDHLVREVTIDSYLERQATEGLDPDIDPETVAHLRARFDGARLRLSKLAMPGDTWWEWVIGTEPLMQIGGLAIVRDGKIIWAEKCWIS